MIAEPRLRELNPIVSAVRECAGLARAAVPDDPALVAVRERLERMVEFPAAFERSLDLFLQLDCPTLLALLAATEEENPADS